MYTYKHTHYVRAIFPVLPTAHNGHTVPIKKIIKLPTLGMILFFIYLLSLLLHFCLFFISFT